MKQKLADIATDEKEKLQGFKVLGVFPFYLNYITTGTHLKLCKIKDELMRVMKGEEPKVSDFYNVELQTQIIPLINKYVVTGLINGRSFGWFFKPLLLKKIKRCGHSQILNLYVAIYHKNEPAFFLSYWKALTRVDHTLLKEEKQS